MSKIVLIFLISSQYCYSQVVVKATYKEHVYNLTDKQDLTPEIILQYITNNSSLICSSNEKFNRIHEVSDIENKKVTVNSRNKLTTHQTGTAYRIIDYKQFKEMFFEVFKEKKSVMCASIDTLRLRFVNTGLTKKIQDWTCSKYSSIDTADKDIEIWLCDALPWHINPGIYLPNIKKGVVSVVFVGKGDITLNKLENTNVNPSLPAKYICTDTMTYNILNQEIRTY